MDGGGRVQVEELIDDAMILLVMPIVPQRN